MKKLITLFIVLPLLINSSLLSKNVNKNDALKVANCFILGNARLAKTASALSVKNVNEIISADGNVQAYVVELSPSGFVVTSTNSNLPPVIAYSDHSNFNYQDCEDNLLLFFIKNYLKNLENNLSKIKQELLIENNKKWDSLLNNGQFFNQDLQQWPVAGTTKTGGWVDVTWDQYPPYNKFCPIDPDTKLRSLTGCVPTAFAQVIYYYKYLGSNLKWYNYTIPKGQPVAKIRIDADSTNLDFPSLSKIKLMMQVIRNKFINKIELDETDIAALNFASGISILSEFGSAGTSGSLFEIFNNGIKSMDYYSSKVATFDVAYTKIVENIMNGNPAILGISNSTGNIMTPNHAIIADGYNTDKYFHVNFGWGPSQPKSISEAWCLLPQNYANYNCVDQAAFDFITKQENINQFKFLSSSILPSTLLGIPKIYDLQFKNNYNTSIKIGKIFIEGDYEISDDGINFSKSLLPTTLLPQQSLLIYVKVKAEKIGNSYSNLYLQTETNNNIIIRLKNCTAPIGGSVLEGGIIETAKIKLEKNKSPYYVTDNIYLTNNSELRIEPGTKIEFIGPYRIEVNGSKFIAKGNEKDSIIFSPYNKSETWRGLAFYNCNSYDSLSYCVISNSDVESELLSSDLTRDEGGAIRSFYSNLWISNSTFRNNKSMHGGAYYQQGGNAIIKNSLFNNNKARMRGGAIGAGPGGKLELSNVILWDNSVIGNSPLCTGGGAISICSFNIIINNSVVYNNKAAIGSSLDVNLNCEATNQFMEVNYSCVDTSSANWIGGLRSSKYFKWGIGNIVSNPKFVNPLIYDFHLDNNSPCIDAGDPDSKYNDAEDPNRKGFALAPAQGTIRNDIGIYGGLTKGVSTDIENILRLPLSFELQQNYPNPFNPITKIKFSLPTNALTKLIIYDILGRQVKTLINSEMPAGYHRVDFNASNLSSGIYFYRIQANNFTSIKKMILIK